MLSPQKVPQSGHSPGDSWNRQEVHSAEAHHFNTANDTEGFTSWENFLNKRTMTGIRQAICEAQGCPSGNQASHRLQRRSSNEMNSPRLCKCLYNLCCREKSLRESESDLLNLRIMSGAILVTDVTALSMDISTELFSHVRWGMASTAPY